ncbi:MAG: ATP-binding protein [Acidobacteria bacterium]|jgi:predicted ATP-dependent endonuclease of OLD family|nr:ATP-binding protein [Acidobacteriota bacterium]
MKLSGIKLKNYYQFKNVEIDLTYPIGHEKAGQPLDKVCFIGQGGTGKTSLLRLIKWFISLDRDIGKNLVLPIPRVPGSIQIDFKVDHLAYMIFNIEKSPFIQYNWPNNLNEESFRYFLIEHYEKVKPILINFPTELLWGKNPPLPQNINISGQGERSEPVENQSTIDFAVEDVTAYWESILKDIRNHRAQELFFKNKLTDATITKDGSPPDKKKIKKLEQEYRKWQSENPSPLDILANECLDPLLLNLGLKVKRDIDLMSIQNLGFIALQNIDGEDIPFDFWSTGTRQLVQTVIPLYQLKPGNAVILIDEPERSLYPDIQAGIIDTYMKLAPGSQFFFATHSPIIASAFEPWEIVELKFDKTKRCVYRELDYEGENHVDNYRNYPDYLRWDSILQRLFDLEEEGSEKRIAALNELTDIELRIEKLKKEGARF